MCKYQTINESGIRMCEYTKKLCTLCVFGNGKTYEEAEKEEQKENEK